MAGMSRISAMFTADTSGLSSGTRQAASSLRGLSSEVAAMRSSLNSLVGINAAQLFGSITSGVTGAAKSFASLASDSANTIDGLSKMAARLGVSYAEMSGLSLAAELAGVSVEALAGAMTKADRAFVEAQRGSESATAAFARIGLSVDQLGSLDARGRFDAIAQALASMPTPAERSAAAIELFGRAGAELLPLFSSGAAGIKESAEWAGKLGLALSDVRAAGVEAMNDSWTLVKASIAGVTAQVVSELAPAIKSLNEVWLEFITDAGGGEGIGRKITDAILDGATVLAALGDGLADQLRDTWATGREVAREWGDRLDKFLQTGRDLGFIKDTVNAALVAPVLGVTGPLQTAVEGLDGAARFMGAKSEYLGGQVAELKGFNNVLTGYFDKVFKGTAADGNLGAAGEAVKQSGFGLADSIESIRKRIDEDRQAFVAQQPAAVKPAPVEPLVAKVVKPIDVQLDTKKLTDALDVRSKEGNKEMLRLMYGGRESPEEKQLRAQEKANEILGKIDSGIDKLGVETVAIP